MGGSNPSGRATQGHLMISVYYGPVLNQNSLDPRIFLDLNHTEYNFYTHQNTPTEVDVHVFSDYHYYEQHLPKTKWYLELEIFHSYEDHVDAIYKQHHQRLSSRADRNHAVIILGIDYSISSEHLHYWDFWFNYVKALYSNFEFSAETVRPWYAKNGYALPDNLSANSKTAIYLAPNNTYNTPDGKKIYYRPQLVNTLLNNYCKLGIVGDPNQGRTLRSQSQYPDCVSLNQLNRRLPEFVDVRGTPIHNEYYKNTFISVYTETIEYGSTLVVSEKTYYPLIKGHFILPFSTNGFVAFLKQKGFKFPDFINYSYDSIVDSDQRFTAYLEELKRLMSLDIDTWKNLWQDNLEIIMFNRQLFFDCDYSKIDLRQYS